MKIFLITLILVSAAQAQALICTSDEGSTVEIQGEKVVSISAPIEVSRYGSTYRLGTDLEIEGSDCNEGSWVNFDSRVNDLVAFCAVDSGPLLAYFAKLSCL